LGEALTGYKKGDRAMVALAPKKVFSGPASDRMIDLRSRAEAWVVVEMEIVRVKSSDKKKKEEPVPVAAPAAASVDQGDAGGRGRTESDLAARMAKLAAKSGGGVNPMAGGMHSNVLTNNNQQQQTQGDNEHRNNSGNQNTGGNQSYDNNQNQHQNQNGGYQNQQNQHQNGGFNQNNGGYNQNQNNGGYNQNQNNGGYNQNQNQNNGGYNQQHNNGYQHQQPSYPAPPADSNPYAVTLVAGQESRSAYMPQNQQQQNQNQFQHNPYGQPSQPSVGYPGQPQVGGGSVDQVLANLQLSMTQLHLKVDRLGSVGLGGGLAMTPKGSAGAGLQVKATELVTVAQSLLSEYETQMEAVEKRTKELDSHASSSTSSMLELKQQYEKDFKEERDKLKKDRDDKEARCEKLEEKLEALQVCVCVVC
jgi:hypothetical protein